MRKLPSWYRKLVSTALLLAVAALSLGQGAVICRVVAGANPALIARTYGIPLLDTTGPSPFALFGVPPSMSLEDVEHLLQADPRVVWAEEDGEMESPEGTGAGGGSTIAAVGDRTVLFGLNKFMLQQVRYASLADLSKGTVRVAVLDNGLSPRQPRLWQNVVASANMLWDGRNPWDLPYNTDTDADGFVDRMVGHGTMVAGLIDMMAPSAKLVIARVADSDGIATAWSLIKGVAYGVQNRCQLANISLGAIEEIPALGDVIDWAESNKMLVIAPIGNDNQNRAIYPSKYGKVVCVAGLLPTDAKAPFSNWESTADVAAPATGILSTWWDGTLGIWSGTSFAAPVVTGSLANALRYGKPKTPSKLRDALRLSGDNIDGLNPAYRGKLGRRLNVTRLAQQLSR